MLLATCMVLAIVSSQEVDWKLNQVVVGYPHKLGATILPVSHRQDTIVEHRICSLVGVSLSPVARQAFQQSCTNTSPPTKHLTQTFSCLRDSGTKMEQRPKERPSTDQPNLGSILWVGSGPWHYYWCHVMIADRKQAWLSSERLY